MESKKSTAEVKKAMQNIKVKVDSAAIFQKMIDSGEGITFDSEGMPMIYKQIKKNSLLQSAPEYEISLEVLV